ncbi:hypothetical protein SAMN05216170_1886 [Thermococcus thioreducens]|uniref:Uncharacterized protein n=1 Tax=Thermococcus thioreducens TaxID=277988 RepID=A0A1I0PKA3_9EURY|nr:hypothetical protein SAMN05216170_1886 [Thermococcus thioreducens]
MSMQLFYSGLFSSIPMGKFNSEKIILEKNEENLLIVKGKIYKDKLDYMYCKNTRR